MNGYQCLIVVKGVAVHPMKPEYATVGDDATLRIWDIYTRNLVKSTVFDTGLTCVAYHPNGDTIMVGMGGPVGGQPYGAKKTVRTKKDGVRSLAHSLTHSLTRSFATSMVDSLL